MQKFLYKTPAGSSLELTEAEAEALVKKAKMYKFLKKEGEVTGEPTKPKTGKVATGKKAGEEATEDVVVDSTAQ